MTIDSTGKIVKKVVDGLCVISFDLVTLVKDPSTQPQKTFKQYLKDVTDISYNKIINSPTNLPLYKRTFYLNSLSSFSDYIFRTIEIKTNDVNFEIGSVLQYMSLTKLALDGNYGFTDL